MIFKILVVVAAVFLVVVFVKWFEWSNIYFPSNRIDITPEYIGLEFKDVYFKASDGTRLNGWFVPVLNGARGTVIICHGNAGNISHRMDILRSFNNLRFNVFLFDYRGYGRSTGFPTEKGTYKDGQAAYDFIVSYDNVDKDKIILYGKSLGGSIAADLATREKVRAVILNSSFSSVPEMAKYIYPFLPAGIISTKYDTMNKVEHISAPIFIIHSVDDEIVPFSHGEKIFENAAHKKEFLRIKGGHNDLNFESEDAYSRELDRFLLECGL